MILIIEDVEVTLNSLRRGTASLCRKSRQHRRADHRHRQGLRYRLGADGFSVATSIPRSWSRIGLSSKMHRRFCPHVEKGTVWNHFNEDEFWKKNNCLITAWAITARRAADVVSLEQRIEAADLLPAR